MAVDLEPTCQGEEEEDRALNEDAPSHNPVAPPNELFDISTTVDPSYIISLIRKLIPPNQSRTACFSGVDGSTSNQKSNSDPSEGQVALQAHGKVENSADDSSEIMDTGDNDDTCPSEERKVDQEPGCRNEVFSASPGEEIWEEYGCILWDLAASRAHAELMVLSSLADYPKLYDEMNVPAREAIRIVENLVLEVLLANLMVSQSTRVIEICLGIMGNLACHEAPMKSIVSTKGLLQVIVDQLLMDDTQCLCEACRLLGLGLQGGECIAWAKALRPDHIVQRLIWIAENTLNPLLIEKSVGLLLIILESQQGVSSILLPPLIDIGLPSVLNNLLAYEMTKLMSERMPERYPALDVILRATEALSAMDDHSQEISSKKELIALVCDLVKFPDKMEIADSCVSAAVLIANILSDVADLALEVSQDLPFLQGLLDTLPFTASDVEARNAVWSIIMRLLIHVQESEMELSSLHQYVSVLASKSDLIEEDLLNHQTDFPSEREKSYASGAKPDATNSALKRISSIVHKWKALDQYAEENSSRDKNHVDVAVERLLQCCHKYTG